MSNDRKTLLHQAELGEVCPSDGDPCLDDQGMSLYELGQTDNASYLNTWQEIPFDYARLSSAELDRRIAKAKEKLGKSLVILGHHYQRDEIVKFADFRGDSFKLSQQAASRADAEYIVFCGVHFMAESADILSGPNQKVILPNLEAGCSMADMASIDDVEDCWDSLTKIYGPEIYDSEIYDSGIIPVTYMNSAADLKAFCGKNGGIVCTSSNARAVMQWAFERGERILFFPDEHLGRNTADKIGLGQEETLVWNPAEELGGHTRDEWKDIKLILWKGFCSVHQRFTVEQIRMARQQFPGINVVVHPECKREVVQAADFDGSTEFIVAKLRQAPAGSQWAIGTEINLVNRLAKENPDKLIFCLDPVVCPCSTMYRIHPSYLAWVLEELVEGRIINRITVDEEVASWARVALERMLSIH